MRGWGGTNSRRSIYRAKGGKGAARMTKSKIREDGRLDTERNGGCLQKARRRRGKRSTKKAWKDVGGLRATIESANEKKGLNLGRK